MHLDYNVPEISVSARGKVQSKTDVFSFSRILQCYVQLADLLKKPLLHFRCRRPPGTLVRKTKRVNKSHARGAPTATWGGRNWSRYCPVRLEPIPADSVLPLPHLELEDLPPTRQHVEGALVLYLSARGVPAGTLRFLNVLISLDSSFH